MLKRVVVAVVEGAVVGGVAAALLAKLGLEWRSPAVVYGAALLTGAATGLVAGKPPWANSAKVEAVLKAAVGAFIAPAAVYGARKWLPSPSFDLGPALGSGSVGELPALLLPVVAIAIALLLEIDDAVGPHATAGLAPKRLTDEAAEAGEMRALDGPDAGADETGSSESPEERGPGARRGA
jgi:hypothetical protein